MSAASRRLVALPALVFAAVIALAVSAGQGYSQEDDASAEAPTVTMEALHAEDFAEGKIADEVCMACHAVEAESMAMALGTQEDQDGTVSEDAASSASADTSAAAEGGADSEAEDEGLMLGARHASLSCSICHPADDIADAHEGVTAPPDKKQQRSIRREARSSMATQEFCLQCHVSMEDLAERTANVTVVQDSKGKVVNPHAIPSNSAHDEAKVSECLNCHWMHGQSPSPNTGCTSCHHSGVYECGTCHEMKE